MKARECLEKNVQHHFRQFRSTLISKKSFQEVGKTLVPMQRRSQITKYNLQFIHSYRKKTEKNFHFDNLQHSWINISSAYSCFLAQRLCGYGVQDNLRSEISDCTRNQLQHLRNVRNIKHSNQDIGTFVHEPEPRPVSQAVETSKSSHLAKSLIS